jgi:DNA-binding Lrp family transcriptional regulator
MPADGSIAWKVFGEICRSAPDPVWGMYPRPPVGPVAEALRISRGTVWRVISEMGRSGFLGEYEIIPNPRLLGMGLRSFNVAVQAPVARASFLDSLEYVEGAFVAFQDLGAPVNVLAVTTANGGRSRAEEAIARMKGVESVTRGSPVWLPECPPRLSLDGWAFISLLRQHPTWSLERLAAALRISSKTASKRYRALRESRSLLSFSTENFAKFPGVVFGAVVAVQPNVNVSALVESVQREFPELLIGPSAIHPPGTIRTPIVFLGPARNAWEIATVESAIGARAGVVRVDTFFPGIARAYRQWFDAHLASELTRERRSQRGAARRA